MLQTGVYYLWLPKAYPSRSFGQSITQHVFVGSYQRFDNSDQKALAKMLVNIQRVPWGFACRFQPNFPQLPSKSITIDNQLETVKECVKRHAQYHEFSLALRPLELLQFWSEELRNLIDQYLEVEELVYHGGLKRKCKWLVKFVEERNIDLVNEGVQFRANKTGLSQYRRYGSPQLYPFGGPQIELILSKEFQNPEIEYVLQRLSVTPIPVVRHHRRRSEEEGRLRVQAPDIVLFYPVFQALIPGLEEYVNELGLRKMIDERWRMYH